MANKSITKALSLMLAVWIAFTNFVPLTVLAVGESTINLDNSVLDAVLKTSADNSGGKYTYDDGTKVITINSGPVTITGNTKSRRIVVAATTPPEAVEVTLDGVNIDVSTIDNAAAFLLNPGAEVTITLSGGNTLTSGSTKAGLQAETGTTLTITGTGSLTATGGGGTVNATGSGGGGGSGIGGGGGGGIGGGRGGIGAINIIGGTVNAIGGSGGIGAINIIGGTVNAIGGSGGSGTINIIGGTVTAIGGGRGGDSGIGIGGGDSGGGSIGGGTITISGGSVNPTSGVSTQPTSNGSTLVYLNTLTLGESAVGAKVAISSITVDGVLSNYGLKDVVTDASDKVYFWLPPNPTITASVSVVADGKSYGKSYKRENYVAQTQTLSLLPYAPEVDFPTPSDNITYGQTLAQSNFSGGTSGRGTFAWEDNSIKPPVGNDSYTVVFTPNDTANYDYSNIFGWDGTSQTVRRTVSIKVAKATPSPPTDLTATYGDTLSSVILPGGWAWDEEGTTLVGTYGTQIHSANYNDTTGNYNNAADVLLSITVAKATAPPFTFPVSATPITYGQTLAESTLSGGDTGRGTFAWEDDSIKPPVSNSGYTVVFTPNDTANYDYSGVTLTSTVAVTVNKAAQNAPTGLWKTDETAIGNDGTITGVTTAMEYRLSTDSSYTPCSDADITGLAPGTYYVRYAETTNYNASSDTQVIIEAYKAPLTFVYNAAYDIPASTVGMAIAAINVSDGASGGTPPYTFGATGLPAGISISTAGVISGVPISAEPSGTATITVTDNAGVSESIAISFGAISAAVTSYTVTFVDWNNAILSTQTIVRGNSATAPANPTREGYTFIGWDTDFTSVKSNLTVKALYEQDEPPVPTYTVTFVDWNNVILSMQTIEHGKAATAPAEPIREGYTFTGWDKTFSNITDHITVTAVYMQNTQPSGDLTPPLPLLPQPPSSPQLSPSSNGNQTQHPATQTPAYRIITIKDRNGNTIDSFDTSVLSLNGKILTLKPSKQSSSYVFNFNLQCLKELETAMKGGKFKITLSGVEYELPFNVASIITGLSNYLRNENLQEYALELTITKLTGDELTKAQDAFRKAFPDSEMPDAFYEIGFGLYKNGKKANYNANRFDNALTFTINTSSKCNAVLQYNPATGKFSFVPAKFSENKSRVNTRHHSIYAAVKNNVVFADVKEGAWYEPYVTAAANLALVEGVGGDLFDPERAVTRAEFVQMIANAMQLPAAKDGTKEYTDVAKTAWYYDAIMRANSAELLNGFTDDGFNPDEAITREEMASTLASVVRSSKTALTTEGVSLEQTFADYGDMGEKYRADIELVYSAKLMDGVGNNCFNPKGSTTRAQAATVQIRLLELLGMIE